MRHTIVDSPLGPLTLVADGDALVGVYMAGQAHRPADARFGDPAPEGDATLAVAADELGEYFAGTRTEFTVPVRAAGTEFQRAIWDAIAEIPYGETATYTELAQQVGRPTAVRAVGAAVGRNPLSVVVPCHRVVGAAGSLTGYAGGLDRKRLLLGLERHT
ncbi:MAG TPA: methylated-DNA--[protein]-cysteine S-methyltransferase [Cellulomonas sp.]